MSARECIDSASMALQITQVGQHEVASCSGCQDQARWHADRAVDHVEHVAWQDIPAAGGQVRDQLCKKDGNVDRDGCTAGSHHLRGINDC